MPQFMSGYLALWVADYFHEFRDLFEVLHQLERKAYTAIDKAYDAAQKFDRAKSEANWLSVSNSMTPPITPVSRP